MFVQCFDKLLRDNKNFAEERHNCRVWVMSGNELHRAVQPCKLVKTHAGWHVKGLL